MLFKKVERKPPNALLHFIKRVLSWQLFEDFSMVMDMTVLMYLVLPE